MLLRIHLAQHLSECGVVTEDTGSRTLFASYVAFVSVTVCPWLVHKLYPGYFFTFKTFSTHCCLPNMGFEHGESLHNLTCIGVLFSGSYLVLDITCLV